MTIHIALYGLGTVGGGLVEILQARRATLRETHGIELALRHVVVRDPERPRSVPVDRDLFTTDWREPLADPEVDVVVEVMGGLEPAGTVIAEALRAGTNVVTANKAVVAERGAEFEALAAEHGRLLRYEAAVAAAIPVLHALRGALVANRVTRVRGIVNGSTNYILTRMGREGLALEEVVADAKALGYLEADPSADLSGLDAAQKLVILARHAFGRWLPVDAVEREGIEGVTRTDIDDALRRGAHIKLVAEAAPGADGAPALRVAPVEVPADDPLGSIHEETNAIVLDTDFAGPLMFVGSGAGAHATGSAVYADLVEAALHATQGGD